MEQNEVMRISIENVRSIVNNSILLLRDTDLLLSREGFSPMHGNTIGSETSKDINQSPFQAGTFFPQYLSRYYSHQDDILKNKILCLNIQLFHFKQETLNPCLIGAVCNLKRSESLLRYWWLKYYAYETSIQFKADGTVFSYEDEDAEVLLWGHDLYKMENKDFLQNEIISKLLNEIRS